MTKNSGTSGRLAALRESAEAALRRLKTGDASRPQQQPTPQPVAPAFGASDPTQALMPGAYADDEATGALPLSTLLEDSAHAMARRKDELRAPARQVARLIAERRNGEVTMAAQALRVVIGIVWLGVAIWLYISVLNARADDIAVAAGGAPLDDAIVLMRTFLIVAAAGLGVAFIVATLTRLIGNADNARVQAEASTLGGAIADAAEEFDSALSGLRAAMDKRGHPADAVDDLSRAHLTALEAHDFFREISFISGAEDEKARRLFKGFLGRAVGPPPGFGGLDLLMTFLVGGIIGAFVVYVVAVPRAEAPSGATATALAIMQYPWAAQLIAFGGLAYASVGLFLSALVGPLTDGVAEKARAEALTALRSGFAAQSALHPGDVTRRIKDAVDVFRARVSGGRPGPAGNQGAGNLAGANHGDGQLDAEADIPEWRRRDSSVKFVDAGFTPAPESWRTDAYAKKFDAEGARGTGSKRGGEGLKNRRRD